MTPGTIALQGNRAFVVLGGSGVLLAVAPLLRTPKVRMAGDVEIEPGLTARVGSASLFPGKLKRIAEITAPVLAKCLAEAYRVSMTRAIVEKHSCQSWHVDASNEITACR